MDGCAPSVGEEFILLSVARGTQLLGVRPAGHGGPAHLTELMSLPVERASPPARDPGIWAKTIYRKRHLSLRERKPFRGAKGNTHFCAGLCRAMTTRCRRLPIEFGPSIDPEWRWRRNRFGASEQGIRAPAGYRFRQGDQIPDQRDGKIGHEHQIAGDSGRSDPAEILANAPERPGGILPHLAHPRVRPAFEIGHRAAARKSRNGEQCQEAHGCF